ncbi:ATP-binding cassette domain-containing protein [Jiangella muralis]|uniref:ATP-binding cassette domain-containing protein n=1 Tax=Jiangella muralis TaxID=702383 RepID=UPI00069D9807|nr:ABC transporter ATP-binding protein [Jiangella muralis]
MSDQRLSPWRAAGRISRYRIGLFSLEFARLVAWNGSMLVIGWLLQQLFDALAGSAPAEFGAYELLAVLAAAEAARLTMIWSGVVGDKCWQHMRGLMRLNLLRALLRSGGPDAGTSATSSGEAVSRFRDDVEDFLAFLQSVTLAAGKVVLLAGSMVIMLSVEPVVAVAVVLPLVAVVVVTRLASTRIRTYRAAYRQSSAAVTGLIAEMFGSVLAVKSANAGNHLVQHLAGLNERRRRTGLKDHLVTQLLWKFNRATVDLSVGVVLLLAAPALHGGSFTVGDLALFVNYTSILVWVPYYIGQMLTRHGQAGVAIDRMAALLPAGEPEALVAHRPLDAPEQPPGPTASDGHAALERLTVCALTATHAASGRGVFTVSFTLERGRFTVVTGPAGAGKTTLLRAVLGLLPAEGGAVYWNGDVVRDRAAFLVPPRSAYVPQVPGLFSESLRENLLLGHEDASALRSAVHAAVLDRDVVTMPSGIDTQVGARGVRLSGGQVQRAAIARALVRRTDLLVLDDVSSALDVETERRLWDRLLADADRTLLVVSNRPATIARADQVIRLDQGRVPVRIDAPDRTGRCRRTMSQSVGSMS